MSYVKEKIKASQEGIRPSKTNKASQEVCEAWLRIGRATTVSYAKEKIKASQGKRGGPSYAKEKIKASLSIPCFT